MENKEIEQLLGNLDFDDDADSSFSKNFFELLSIIKDKDIFNYIIVSDKKEKIIPKKMGFFKKLVLINERITKKNEYISSAYIVGLLLSKMGYKFSPSEYSRLFLCGLMTTGKTNIRELRKSSEESKNEEFQEELKNLIEVVNNNEKTKNFIANYVNNNDKLTDNWQEVFKILSSLVILYRVNLNSVINRNIAYMNDAISVLKDSYEILDLQMDAGVSEEFVQSIYSSIPKNISREELPYQIYTNLNRAVIYNSIMFSWNQNTNVEPVNEVYNKSFNDLTKKSNDLSCKAWAEFYAYLLKKEGYRVFVSNRKSLHRKVVFFDDNNDLIIADGTNNNFNKYQPYDMCDITRAKMDLNPGLFYILDADNRGRTRNRFYYNGEFLTEQEICKLNGEFSAEEKRTIKLGVSLAGRFKIKNNSVSEIQERNPIQEKSDSTSPVEIRDDEIAIWKDILKFMECKNNIPEELKNLSGQSEDEINLKKLELINCITLNVTSKYKDDDLMVYDCLSNLIFLLYKEGNQFGNFVGDVLGENNFSVKTIKLSNNLYKIENNRAVFVPLLYLRQNEELNYYIWDKDDGLQQISKEEVIEKIRTGELHSRNNNKSLSKYNLDREVIEGIKSPYKPFSTEVEIIKKKLEAHNYENLGWEAISFDDYFSNECFDEIMIPEDDCK